MFLPAYSTNQQDSIHGIDKDACSNSVETSVMYVCQKRPNRARVNLKKGLSLLIVLRTVWSSKSTDDTTSR